MVGFAEPPWLRHYNRQDWVSIVLEKKFLHLPIEPAVKQAASFLKPCGRCDRLVALRQYFIQLELLVI